MMPKPQLLIAVLLLLLSEYKTEASSKQQLEQHFELLQHSTDTVRRSPTDQCHDDSFHYFVRSSTGQLSYSTRFCSSICPPENARTDNDLGFCTNNCREYHRCLRQTLPNSTNKHKRWHMNDSYAGNLLSKAKCRVTQYYDPITGYTWCLEPCHELVNEIASSDDSCRKFCPAFYSCVTNHNRLTTPGTPAPPSSTTPIGESKTLADPSSPYFDGHKTIEPIEGALVTKEHDVLPFAWLSPIFLIPSCVLVALIVALGTLCILAIHKRRLICFRARGTVPADADSSSLLRVEPTVAERIEQVVVQHLGFGPCHSSSSADNRVSSPVWSHSTPSNVVSLHEPSLVSSRSTSSNIVSLHSEHSVVHAIIPASEGTASDYAILELV